MKEAVLRLARAAIGESLEVPQHVSLETLIADNPALKETGATFVTLTYQGELRGCIGSLVAYRPLYEDIIYNARSAAFKDPRFEPLCQEELEDIVIEVSILSQPQHLEYHDADDLKKKIKKNHDGVVLQYGTHHATFLPQVWEQLPTFELFFSYLCQKAGLGADCLASHPEISVYSVQKYKES
ncbi:AmmeMemoRadiSam system protein A [Sulfurospirillum sp. 1612]|uniref:AmmeMemoRadiSam system protein A n=1 Tax=Sulfurospirillum sp. 1612 TaxID=3094835 RepID=UPI002F949F70